MTNRLEIMQFSTFIRENLQEIAQEWSAFARTLKPSAGPLSDQELRDHCQEMLLAICQNMETRQTDRERAQKSTQMEADAALPETAAATHGGLRQLKGFDLLELVGEFRAMRASVLALWRRSGSQTTGDDAVEEIIRFNEAIDQALAESVEGYSARVESSRDMFLAVLGHDLRSPLTGIYMSSKLLTMPGVTEAARLHASTQIGRACKTMTGLITDLLEFTKSRLGEGIPIERAPCDLAKVCGDALDSAKAGHPALHFEVETSGELGFNGDAPRLGQVLSNLLSNAIQHGDRRKPIVLAARGEKSQLVLTVFNQGRPIDSAALPAIFEPLVQACEPPLNDVDERSATSLGLGLYIVREIVRGHGGDVSVSSTSQTGTLFTVTLPRHEVAD